MAPVVKVDGADSLRRALRKAGDNLDDLKSLHLQVAQFVAEVAYGMAPRRSTDLADTIRPNASKTKARVAVGSAKVRYAGPVHWGWPTGSPKLPKKLQRFNRREWMIAPNEWIVEAAQASEHIWLRTYADGIGDIVDQIGIDAGRGL